jgi:hypothetical protein
MNSQQMNLDVIANNLANVNTTGFKKSKIEFQDLLYDMRKIQGAEAGDGQLTPGGIQIGHGSRPVSTSKVFTTGDLDFPHVVQQILELYFTLLETRRVDVGQVVGNHIQVHLLGVHPGC